MRVSEKKPYGNVYFILFGKEFKERRKCELLSLVLTPISIRINSGKKNLFLLKQILSCKSRPFFRMANRKSRKLFPFVEITAKQGSVPIHIKINSHSSMTSTNSQYYKCKGPLALMHSEWPKLYGVLAFLSAKGLNHDKHTRAVTRQHILPEMMLSHHECKVSLSLKITCLCRASSQAKHHKFTLSLMYFWLMAYSELLGSVSFP